MDTTLYESDWESFSESSGSEDQGEIDFQYSGQAQSILHSLEGSIRRIDDFLSSEREFMVGDIVSSISDPCGQMGKVVDVNIFVDLENIHGYIIRDVSSKKLQKLRSISEGDYVIHGPWLGRVNKVIECVIVLFDDGSKYETLSEDQDKLTPVSFSLYDSQLPYYGGQRVKVHSGISKSRRRLCGTKEGTVFSVEAGQVHVCWIASVVDTPENCPAPSSIQNSKDLTVLPYFLNELWNVGDWCSYPYADSDAAMEQNFIDVDVLEGIRKQGTGIMRRDPRTDSNDMFVISRKQTKVDVLWQNGSHTIGLDSTSLNPVNIVDAHEFWPEQFVLEKPSSDSPWNLEKKRWGVVRSMDSKERTVEVVWRSFGMNSSVKANMLEETMSAYELVEHPEFSYFFGDIVFKVRMKTFKEKDDEQASENHDSSESLMGDEADHQTAICYGNQKVASMNCYLYNIGYIASIKDGSITVRWATGKTSQVAPYEISRVNVRCPSVSSPYEENFEDQETRTENLCTTKESILHSSGPDYYLHPQKVLDINGGGEDCTRYSWSCKSLSIPKAAIGFFTNIAAAFFGSHSSTLSIGMSKGGNEYGIVKESDAVESQDLSDEDQLLVNELQNGTHEKKILLPIPCSEKVEHFKQFDGVSDCSDHHFVDGPNKGSILSQVNRYWLKKVQQEWRILASDLPESIFVRFYEERMDLLRAAIIGADGTPYQDGLFFFDIFLPPSYPHEAPSVHYISGGLRLNPNLYESGRVCLSLLNTWNGTGTEVWNPRNSTILQLLLSLQALVLNDKPYYNEAGYEAQKGRADGEKNSVSYNENAYLVTCKSMLYTLQNPPKNFEALVEEHFRRRSAHILMACRAYMERVPVGNASGDKTLKESEKGSSAGFRIMLSKLLRKLVDAFADKGIECSEFIRSQY